MTKEDAITHDEAIEKMANALRPGSITLIRDTTKETPPLLDEALPFLPTPCPSIAETFLPNSPTDGLSLAAKRVKEHTRSKHQIIILNLGFIHTTDLSKNILKPLIDMKRYCAEAGSALIFVLSPMQAPSFINSSCPSYLERAATSIFWTESLDTPEDQTPPNRRLYVLKSRFSYDHGKIFSYQSQQGA